MKAFHLEDCIHGEASNIRARYGGEDRRFRHCSLILCEEDFVGFLSKNTGGICRHSQPISKITPVFAAKKHQNRPANELANSA
jgi:hypothetical protein